MCKYTHTNILLLQDLAPRHGRVGEPLEAREPQIKIFIVTHIDKKLHTNATCTANQSENANCEPAKRIETFISTCYTNIFIKIFCLETNRCTYKMWSRNMLESIGKW